MSAIFVLVAVALATFADRNLHPVVAINGVNVDRASFRARLDLDAALLRVERDVLQTALSAGSIAGPEHQERLAQLAARAADPVRVAIDGLVDDELIRQAAAERELSVEADVGAELEREATAGLVRRIAFVSIVESSDAGLAPTGDWPRPAPTGAPSGVREQRRAVAIERAGTALAGGTGVGDVVADLRAAGWLVDGEQRWIGLAGPLPPMPDGLLAGLRAPGTANGALVGPVDDGVHGRTAIGIVVEQGDATFAPARELVETSGLDAAVVRSWAEARALERALVADLLVGWQSQPQAQVRAAELVVGSAALEGSTSSYVELAHLVVGQVPPGDIGDGAGSTPGERAASRLRALDRTGREVAFGRLVDAANAFATDDPLRRSGELSFFSRDQLIEPLSTAAFADGAKVGDLVGPVTTTVGEELFLVRARFEGVLDERANAALVEARTATDLAALARRISPPGDADRAVGELWRSELEIGVEPASHRAFIETPIGTLSDPFVLDGQLVVVRPIERRNALLDAAALDRLRIRGFHVWLAGRRSAAVIVIDHDPLGLGLPTPSPSTTASADTIETPGLPSLPAVEPSAAATFVLPTPQRLP